MMNMKLREPDPKLRDWLPTDTPTARIFSPGPDALSDAEVLSILLRTGTRGQSSIELARELLATHKSLSATINASFELVSDQHARLLAARELMRRALKEQICNGNALSSPSAVREYLRIRLQALPHEVFVALFLDAQNRVIEIEELFRGTLTQTSVYPREVVKRALHHNAGAVIFAHNHPSGVAEPSHADETLTNALKQALALIDVRVLDHFIVAGGGVLSFAERGLI